MAGRFEALADTVAPAVLLKATEVSQRLSEAGVPHALEVPIIPVEALILLKLHANRPQDRVDVTALLRAGANTAKVQDYLRERAPALAARFAELVPSAEE